MQFILIWAIAVVAAQGPVTINSKERNQFDNKEACEQFAKAHHARMEDWTRGLLRLDWDYPVIVTARCVPSGQPT